AIRRGFFQQEIADAAFAFQRQVERGEQVIVGVNQYADPEAKVEIPILEMDPHGYDRQVARLQQLRLERDNERVGSALAALREAARGTQNLMPFILEAARSYATLQEIMDVFRAEFGVYQEDNAI
ncbi:MAG: methylmalonyl-CoA mutase, partial [Chloroflexota bacterium]